MSIPMTALALLLAAGTAAAQEEPKQVLDAAVQAYQAEGAEGFIKKALEGGPMEGNKDALAQSNMMRTVESYYGAYQSYELVETAEAGSSVRFVYAVMNYADGPLFAVFTFYRGGKGWKVVNFKFHTEAWQVWPPELMTK
jgi:hypothetical protein